MQHPARMKDLDIYVTHFFLNSPETPRTGELFGGSPRWVREGSN